MTVYPIDILGVSQQCNADTHPEKIDLTIGAYRDDSGLPVVLNSVREAEKLIFESKANHEYLSQDGYASFIDVSQVLLFGEDSKILKNNNLYTIQGISGTGSLRLAIEFISKLLKPIKCFIPEVTWNGHNSILEESRCDYGFYRYLDKTGYSLDFLAMTSDLNKCPVNSVILFHSCAHNPTGVDPTEDEWKELLKICLDKKFLVLFDNAYQGFVSGDPSIDAFAIRLFANAGVEIIVACSFAKNFGLYGQRVGCLHFLCRNSCDVPRVSSQLRVLSRALYSTCPSYGARIVSVILKSPSLKQLWLTECNNMANRISTVRKMLYDELIHLNVKGSWEHILIQKGMFSYTGIKPQIVEQLKADFHIYMLSNGRISIAGLNSKNIHKFASALLHLLGSN